MDQKKAVAAIKDFLTALDIDIEKYELEETPERVAKMYTELFSGIKKDTKDIWGKTFATSSDGIVAVRNIPFYSMCEHHLLPFFGEVHIAYIPHEGRVAGFSKFKALVDVFSHRPQLQERFTCQIADAIYKDLSAEGVMVVVEAKQLCMTMRGDMSHETRTISTESRGLLKNGSEFYKEAYLLLMKGEKV